MPLLTRALKQRIHVIDYSLVVQNYIAFSEPEFNEYGSSFRLTPIFVFAGGESSKLSRRSSPTTLRRSSCCSSAARKSPSQLIQEAARGSILARLPR